MRIQPQLKMPPDSPCLQFYLPEPFWIEDLPDNPNENWSGYGLGLYCWTLQTYQRLQQAGLPCRLTRTLPKAGIVFCHSNILSRANLDFSPARYIISLKGESTFSSYALMHIVQNPAQAFSPINTHYLPHWPQPGLIPRDPARGNRFENVAFLGHQNSLAPELRTDLWHQELAKRGLRDRTIANTNSWNQHSTLNAKWNDYSQIDAIIAIRTFNPVERILTRHFAHKPATKLYNAWHSGAIALLGPESAYRATGRPNTDYLEVRTFSQLLTQLDRLISTPPLRQTLRQNGHAQGKHYTFEKIEQRWITFIQQVLYPSYHTWCQQSEKKRYQTYRKAKAISLSHRVINRTRLQLLKPFN